MPRKVDPLLGRYFRSVERFPKIRQSTLSAFDSCGLSSKFESELRRGWSTHPQARGQMFHRVAADCLRTMAMVDEGYIEVDVALAHLRESLRQDEVDRHCPACESDNIRPGVRDGMRTCGACGHLFETELVNLPAHEVKDLYWIVKKWAHGNEWDIDNLVSVEERLDARVRYPNPLGGTVERIVTGKLDAVFTHPQRDDRAIVLDWKDTWGMPAPAEISFEGYFQQRMYGWLVMVNYPAYESVTLREFYVRYGEPREVTLWREDLDEVEQEFTALVERFDRAAHEQVHVPTPGKHCSWCMRPSKCPILPVGRGIGRIRTEAEAMRLAHVQTVGKAHHDQATKALQVWSSLHGPIPIKDAKGRRELGYRETERTARPTRETLQQAIREAGSAQGLNIDDLFTTQKTTRFDHHAVPRVVTTDNDAALIAQLEGSLATARADHRGS